MFRILAFFIIYSPFVTTQYFEFPLKRNESMVLDESYFPLSSNSFYTKPSTKVRRRTQRNIRALMAGKFDYFYPLSEEQTISTRAMNRQERLRYLRSKICPTLPGYRIEHFQTGWSAKPRRILVFVYHSSEDYMRIDPVKVIESRLNMMKIIPYVISDSPPEFCNLTYGDRKNLLPGFALPLSMVEKTLPIIKWSYKKENEYFTLLFTRLTSKFNHLRSVYDLEQRHNWIVCNIPGCDISKGQTILPYNMTPASMLTPGHYIYFFLIVKQKGKIHVNIPTKRELPTDPVLRFFSHNTTVERDTFRIRDFLDINWLKLEKIPAAAHFYYAFF